MNALRRLSMHQRHANTLEEAKRDKALFIIPKSIVFKRERRASKDFLRINEIKPVLPEIISSLGFTPRKSHSENVYTYRLFVKRTTGKGLTPRAPRAATPRLFGFFTDPTWPRCGGADG